MRIERDKPSKKKNKSDENSTILCLYSLEDNF